MSTVQRLENIIMEANEALAHATSGGHTGYVFDLVVDPSELTDAYNVLFELNGRIADEIALETGEEQYNS